MKRVLSLLLSLSLPAAALASGDFDERFDADGIRVQNVSGGVDSDAFHAGLIDAQGRFVGAGSRLSDSPGAILVRALPDGTADPSFGTGGVVHLAPLQGFDVATWQAVVERPNGNLLAGGFLRDNVKASEYALLCEYRPDGSHEPGFANALGCRVFTLGVELVSQQRIVDLALQPDGRLLAVGVTQADDDPQPDAFIIRFDVDGSVDSCFAAPNCLGQGLLIDPLDGPGFEFFDARAVAIAPDGRIVVAGGANGGDSTDMAVLRLSANGDIDANFGDGGKVLVAFDEGGINLDRANDVVVGPTGGIYLVGEVTNDLGRLSGAARLDAEGDPQLYPLPTGRTVFFFNDVSPNQVALEAALDAKGRLVVAGYAAGEGASIGDCGVARLGANGILDPVFASGGSRSIDANFGEGPLEVFDTCTGVDLHEGSIGLFGSTGVGLTVRDTLMVKLDQDGILRDGFED